MKKLESFKSFKNLKLLSSLMILSSLVTLSSSLKAFAFEVIKIEDLNSLSSKSFVTLVEYYNPDCPHCIEMEPILTDLQRLYPENFKIYKVLSPDPLMKEIYNVNGTPEILIFKDGELTYQAKGFMPFKVLKKLISLPYDPKMGDFATPPTQISEGCCPDEAGS